jgi:hypothetical protein
MKEFTYTLTGNKAVAASILDEVYAIFDVESSKDKENMYEEWRLEYYIMCIMCAPANIHWELRRSDIAAQVEKAFPGYGRESHPWARAFRRLTRRGFLYGSYTGGGYMGGKRERSYGLALTRYEKEEAA